MAGLFSNVVRRTVSSVMALTGGAKQAIATATVWLPRSRNRCFIVDLVFPVGVQCRQRARRCVFRFSRARFVIRN